MYRAIPQVFKEEEEAVKVELHEGCGRIKLYWTMALADYRTLKGLIEFREASSGEELCYISVSFYELLLRCIPRSSSLLPFSFLSSSLFRLSPFFLTLTFALLLSSFLSLSLSGALSFSFFYLFSRSQVEERVPVVSAGQSVTRECCQ